MGYRTTIVSLLLLQSAWAAVTGRIAGTVTDPTGAAIPGAAVTVINTAQGIQTKATTDAKGEYSLPSLPVGTYDLLFESNGFRTEKRTGLVIDANAAIEQNMTLKLAQHNEQITVTETANDVHVETASTQLGE